MPNLLTRLLGGGTAVPEAKSSHIESAHMLMAIRDLQSPDWTRRSFPALAQEGYMRNPIVHRCVRLIAEAATQVPLVAREDGKRLSEHPLLHLLRRPNPQQSGSELLEAVYAYLQTAGNAYLHAVVSEGEVKGLFGLRPDRMQAVVGRDGYAEAYAYTAGGRKETLRQDTEPVSSVLHMALFHPLDDHYGLAPLEAAQTSLDLHNAASRWNKALLDNSARPSGALVYSAGAGTLTHQQFDRLKGELEVAFQGAANAGRPMVLEGGLDWKPLGISPRDMDFIEAKHVAAREIALAFGVPPMLLGIPGDNTYANMVEANRALWRQTIVPLVRRVADELSFWLAPGFGGVTVEPDFDGVEALAEDQASRWSRVGGAGFLSDEEKREMLGVGDLADGVARSLTNAFRGAIVDGRSLRGVLGEVSQAFADIALKAALKPVGTLISSGVETLFNGLNPALAVQAAAGAPVAAARQAEARPGGAVNVAFNVTASDARSFVASEAEVSAMLLRAVRRGTRAS